MARKAVVDRDEVLQLLKEGHTSQSIASRFGVSRQAIDLHRKEFIKSGLLQGIDRRKQVTTPPAERVKQVAQEPVIPPSITVPSLKDLSLDQMIELMIQAFSALKRINEMETEVSKYRAEHETLVRKIEQLEEREKKRKEQESRWFHAQNPDILTNK